MLPILVGIGVAPLPPCIVLAIISTTTSFLDLMRTELLSPELEVEIQEIEEDEEVMENMQQEIECPRSLTL